MNISTPFLLGPLLLLLFFFVCDGAPVFGVLNGQGQHSASDYAAGIRAAAIDIYWNRYQVTEANYSSSYINGIKTSIQQFRAAGLNSVTIGVNLHNSPTWLLQEKGANYTSQFGKVATGSNVIFSQNMRDKARAYIFQIARAIGLDFNVRVGFAPDAGELLYPSASGNGFWCFDDNAQKGGPDLPAGTPVCPYPGWLPGSKTYDGKPFTTSMASEYYNWYISALVKAGDWMQQTYIDAGFTGTVEWLMPGNGMKPYDVDRYVTNLLNATIPFDSTTGPRAPVWHTVIPSIANKTNVRIQVTSLGDNSGTANGQNCTDSDPSVLYNNTGLIQNWSSGRWITYNARQNGLPVSSENPGNDTISTIWKCAGIMLTCQIERWYFAHDYLLYDNFTGKANLNDFSAVIASVSAAWPAPPSSSTSTTSPTSSDSSSTSSPPSSSVSSSSSSSSSPSSSPSGTGTSSNIQSSSAVKTTHFQIMIWIVFIIAFIY